MPNGVRNLDYLRGKDPKLFEAIQDLIQQHQNLAQQVNGNPIGDPLPPPPVDALTVTGQNGQFHFQIQHNAEVYRGVRYYVEHADNPAFQNPHVIDLGDSRSGSVFMGNVTRYFRAYAAYPTSKPSQAAYHGGSNAMPVSGGGSIGGPAMLDSQGSGTGAPGEGLAGPGRVPFRSRTGAPPVRGETQASGGSGSALRPGPQTGLPPGGAVAGTQGGSPATMQYLTATQSQLAGIAAGLNNASQVTVYVSDYDHTLVWTGTGWRFASGERAGFIEGFLVDPSPATGWQLCDGSAGVTYLKSDGSTGSLTVPNLTGSPAYLKFGAAVTGINSPVAPTLTMNPYTPTGTVSQPTLTMNSYTPQGTVSQPTFTGSALPTHQHESPFAQGGASLYMLGNPFGGGIARTATFTVACSASSTAVVSSLTSAVSAGTPSGTVSQPTFSGTPATLTGTVSQPTFSGNTATLTGTISTTGEPQSIVLRPWFRR